MLRAFARPCRSQRFLDGRQPRRKELDSQELAPAALIESVVTAYTSNRTPVAVN